MSARSIHWSVLAVLALAAAPLPAAETLAALETAVAAAPNDLKLRDKLLRGYFAMPVQDETAAASRAKHVYWIIENHPGSAMAGEAYTHFFKPIQPRYYETGKRLWEKRLAAPGAGAAVLANAAGYFLQYDEALAEGLYKRLQSVQPSNPEWRKRLSHLYWLQARSSTIARGSPGPHAARAHAELEQAIALSRDPDEKFSWTIDLAEYALAAGRTAEAEGYARQILRDAGRRQSGYPNSDDANHRARTVLGLIAIRRGNAEEAKAHLRESAKVDGSPVLRSFGPSMELARELMRLGQKESVLDYLESCRGFWESGQKDLAAWIGEIRSTGTTDFKPRYEP